MNMYIPVKTLKRKSLNNDNFSLVNVYKNKLSVKKYAADVSRNMLLFKE